MKKNNKIFSFISLILSLSIVSFGINVHAETTFEKIKRTGKVTVGTEAAFPPFEFVEDGKIVGYGKDILDYIIADLGAELNQLDLPWQGILPGVLAGKFDFVATSVSIRAERAKKYALHHFFIATHEQLMMMMMMIQKSWAKFSFNIILLV